jgi:two-component system response regulator PilR (NtrC family)
VLVIDDEADLRELLSLALVRLGLDVDTAATVSEARGRLAVRQYALALTDMRLPDGHGLEVVREAAAASVPVAVITAFGSADNAVAALKAGAFDYLTKPVDLEQLRALVRSVVRPEPGASAAAAGAVAVDALARLLGDSAAMQQVRTMIPRLARSMAPVAIFGESGTGKELAARAIHDASPRAAQLFVAVNCGAIPETLMEAEFFGYRKGAFTGADRDREGFFQAAAGGTLFLDEAGELPLAMQVKLLRAIQERRVRRVGAAQEEAVDVRLISATHQDLPRLVAEGRFRQDLFYRLNVLELRMPALRERREDVPLLAEAILARVAERVGLPSARLSPAAATRLAAHAFPGNVRELENVLERAVALSGDDVLMADDLMLPGADVDLPLDPEPAPAAAAAEGDPASAAPAAPAYEMVEGVPSSLEAYLDAREREAVLAALARTRQNRTAAAQLLGLTFRQLRYRMQRLGLK